MSVETNLCSECGEVMLITTMGPLHFDTGSAECPPSSIERFDLSVRAETAEAAAERWRSQAIRALDESDQQRTRAERAEKLQRRLQRENREMQAAAIERRPAVVPAVDEP